MENACAIYQGRATKRNIDSLDCSKWASSSYLCGNDCIVDSILVGFRLDAEIK